MEAWGRPLESFALATTRLAGAGNNSSLNVSVAIYALVLDESFALFAFVFYLSDFCFFARWLVRK